MWEAHFKISDNNQGSPLPSPCTAFSQSHSVNSFQWRIRDEQAGNAYTKTECACVRCFFKMADFFELFKMLQTAGSYGFKTLVDTCDIVYRILSTLQNQQHIMYSPLTIANSQAAAFLTLRARLGWQWKSQEGALDLSRSISFFGQPQRFHLPLLLKSRAGWQHRYHITKVGH